MCANKALKIYMYKYLGDGVGENKPHSTAMRTTFLAQLLSPQRGHQNEHMGSRTALTDPQTYSVTQSWPSQLPCCTLRYVDDLQLKLG